MRHEKEVLIPARTETRTTKTTCDLCGAEKMGWRNWDKQAAYEISDTEVELETGTSYPEGGSVTKTSFDICPTCFTTKLIPWFESQGAKATTKEIDF